MYNWLTMQAADVSRQILENPYVTLLCSIMMWLFGVLFGDEKIFVAGYTLYIIMIGLDWLSGTEAAKKDGIDTSSYSLEGWKRTAFLIVLPLVARLVDIVIGTGLLVMGVVLGGMLRGVTRSVLANIKRAGWGKWMPDGWIEWIQSELNHKDARAMKRMEEIKLNKKQKGDEKDGD